jgi:hypothetical protein
LAASDDELARLLRGYRVAQQLVQRRAELQITAAWRQTNFGLSNASWLRWAADHPEMLALPAGELDDSLTGQLRLKLKLGREARQPLKKMTAQSPEWEQLRLALEGTQLSLWSEQALRAAESAQYQTAVATNTFLARYTMAARGTKVIAAGVPPATVTTQALRGIDGRTVWARPVSEMRIALFEGHPITVARQLAAQRSRTLLGTDTQLAHVRSAVRYFKERGDRDNIVGYRRVPRGGRSCALCLLASTQRYHRGDLMPIHDHCHCVTEPIYGDRDPGQVIEPVQLKAVHAQIEAATGSSDLSGGNYRDAVIVHHHGEIGPVLTYREHSFTGPSDLNANN